MGHRRIKVRGHDMPYNGQYIFPPRTKMTAPFYNGQKESNGISDIVRLWLKIKNVKAQFKLNGNRNLIKVSPAGDIEMWNRHQERQKYSIPQSMKDEILRISPPGVWTVWDSELMDTKTKEIKDVIYMYDILVWQSEFMVGQTYDDRYNLLEKQVGQRYIPLDVHSIKEPMYLARNFEPHEWEGAWRAASKLPWIEGFVLKRFDHISRLEKGTQEYNNSGFMCRIRKPHKNYLS
jgi:hypothetical protein